MTKVLDDVVRAGIKLLICFCELNPRNSCSEALRFKKDVETDSYKYTNYSKNCKYPIL